MSELADSSVHLIVTSPPYWQLKDYGVESQIGFHDSYAEYINNLNLVWQECFRVLHSGCRMAVNIGDQFARSVFYGRYKVVSIQSEIIRFCETIGFDFMGSIIWQKVTTMNTTGGAAVMGSFPYPRNGIVKIDYEYILLFKKLGQPPKPSDAQKESSRLTNEEWNQFFYGHWNFPGERQQHHLAAFPEELPKRLIRMFSFVGETVLDPFAGSGTTSVAARRLQRDSVAYEINKDFIPIIQQRLLSPDSLYEEPCEVSVLEVSHLPTIDTLLKKLPYLASDPRQIDKKVDPRQFRFGSKVADLNETKSRTYRVVSVLSDQELELDTGLVVKLLGVETIKGCEQKAAQVLENLVLGKTVHIQLNGYAQDTSERLQAHIKMDGQSLSQLLVQEGLARTIAQKGRKRDESHIEK